VIVVPVSTSQRQGRRSFTAIALPAGSATLTHGFSSATPRLAKSFVLRVTTMEIMLKAVAVIEPSAVG
jgi:hypothetical protein